MWGVSDLEKNSTSCESIDVIQEKKHVQLYRHCLFQYIAFTLHRLMPSHLTQRSGMHFMVVFSSQLPFLRCLDLVYGIYLCN